MESSVSTWQAFVNAYRFSIDSAETGHEIIAYHWHPTGRSHELEPHLHLGAGLESARPELFRAHFPTGVITFHQIVQVLLTGFGVTAARPDWRAVLTRERAALS